MDKHLAQCSLLLLLAGLGATLIACGDETPVERDGDAPLQIGSPDVYGDRKTGSDELLGSLGVERIADLRHDSVEGVDPGLLSLDVYTRDDLHKAPIVVYVHGGAWLGGDKEQALSKPAALVPAGFLMVSINYRFRPQVGVAEMAGDVARATAWVVENGARYGGDPGRIFLMGHSAGAHLVSVVGTNEDFLQAAGLTLANLTGVISLDTGPYNASLQGAVEQTPLFYPQLMEFVFCNDPELLESCSPWHHVEPGKQLPAFLVFYSEGRIDAAHQSLPFVARLQTAGVDARAVEAVGKTHSSLDTDIGSPGDQTTRQILDFLKRLSTETPPT